MIHNAQHPYGVPRTAALLHMQPEQIKPTVGHRVDSLNVRPNRPNYGDDLGDGSADHGFSQSDQHQQSKAQSLMGPADGEPAYAPCGPCAPIRVPGMSGGSTDMDPHADNHSPPPKTRPKRKTALVAMHESMRARKAGAQGAAPTTNRRIVRLPVVIVMTGLSRSSVYSAIEKGVFPEQVGLLGRCVGWYLDEIEAWIDSRKPR